MPGGVPGEIVDSDDWGVIRNRGFETITYMLDGHMRHEDSRGVDADCPNVEVSVHLPSTSAEQRLEITRLNAHFSTVGSSPPVSTGSTRNVPSTVYQGWPAILPEASPRRNLPATLSTRVLPLLARLPITPSVGPVMPRSVM